MSTLVAITFAGEADARAALGSIRALEKEGRHRHRGHGRRDQGRRRQGPGQERGVERHRDRRGRRRRPRQPAVRRLPARASSAARSSAGSSAERPRPASTGTFVKEVEAGLPPGGSALFLLIKCGEPGLLIAAMRQYQGTSSRPRSTRKRKKRSASRSSS